MKTIITLIAFITSFTILAQNFTLIGERNLGSDFGWDNPTPSNTYTDANGNIFVYLTESSQPRTNELIRYDATNDSWENLTNNTFMIPGNSSTTSGIGLPDGSILTVTRNFGGEHFAHRIMPDGSFEELGDLSNTNNENLKISTAINPITNEFYYFHAGAGNVRAARFDGTEWIQLPDIENVSSPGVSGIDMGFDELGNLYVTYRGGDTDRTRVAVFDGVEWTNIFTNSVFSAAPNIYVVSSTEIYLANSIQNTNIETYLYDGTSFTPFGNTVDAEGTVSSESDILLASNGELFLSIYREDGFFRFNQDTDEWEIVDNDIADGQRISGFRPRLLEVEGFIYSTFADDSGITTVRFNESVLNVNENEINDNSLVIHPNPANNFITVTREASLEQGNLKVNIFDLNGRKVISREINTINNQIDLSTLSSSAYIMIVEDESKQILKRQQIIKL